MISQLIILPNFSMIHLSINPLNHGSRKIKRGRRTKKSHLYRDPKSYPPFTILVRLSLWARQPVNKALTLSTTNRCTYHPVVFHLYRQVKTNEQPLEDLNEDIGRPWEREPLRFVKDIIKTVSTPQTMWQQADSTVGHNCFVWPNVDGLLYSMGRRRYFHGDRRAR